MKSSIPYIVGVDEVGRGPIAGPVAVGAVVMPATLSWRDFRGLRDSKKLSHQAREEWFSILSQHPKVRFAVSFSSHSTIDTRGIVPSIESALHRSLKRLDLDHDNYLILLDGGLKAPAEFVHQKTIIKGDEKECAIACASVMAKVLRDRRMIRLGKRYPHYSFEAHKGYGTKKHYECINTYGVCDIHRKSFLH